MTALFVVSALLATASGFVLDTFIHKTPHTVTQLDDAKYLGRWYQMWSSESVGKWFEQGAKCVTADYGLSPDGRITVLNSERVSSPTGHLKVIHGFVNKTAVVGQLKVSLETVPFAAPYWVLKLGPATFGANKQYQYSIVSDNIEGTLFVLARDRQVFKAQYEAEVLKFLSEQGFTTFYNKPIRTYQESDCVYNPDKGH
ncbi:temperature-induced lipocalin-1-like [Haliotis rufescens]|uniref:temperature-induced lipocalin-1-like n=1 Tax=Haliotis rufescens TaxID=6454 RepID=UPI001EAFF2AF|nr:temperature-induced lipocalin-1-like [Haliotis rufescens]